MSDLFPETPASTAGTPLTDEQQAFLTAQAAQQAAAESAGVTEAAAASASQMTERGPLLPAESDIEKAMAQLKAFSAQLEAQQAQLSVMQRQQEEAQAASGGPLTVRYAQGAADKLDALSTQWPAHDLSAAKDAVSKLVETATAVAKGQVKIGDPTASASLTHAANAIARVVRKLPHIDSSALIDDVELAAEEGLKLLAA